MHFRDPKKELPEGYRTVFVRIVCGTVFAYDFAYYISAMGRWYPSTDSEVVFSIDSVIGWMPITEFNSIEIK